MKSLKVLLILVITSIATVHLHAEQVYIVLDNKAYKTVEYDCKHLATNEYTPLSKDAYIDDYFTSKKYLEARHANNLLFKIRKDRMQYQTNNLGEGR